MNANWEAGAFFCVRGGGVLVCSLPSVACADAITPLSTRRQIERAERKEMDGRRMVHVVMNSEMTGIVSATPDPEIEPREFLLLLHVICEPRVSWSIRSISYFLD